MKPVASGCELTPDGLRNDDALALQAAAAVQLDYSEINPYAFAPPIAPHIAAARAGCEIDLEVLRKQYETLAAAADFVVVEGAGGWRVPLSGRASMADLAAVLGLPVLLVVGMRLGCLNHALLSAEAVCADGLELGGWVANSPAETMPEYAENVATLNSRLGAPCLGEIPFQHSVGAGDEIVDCLRIDRFFPRK